MSKKLKAGQEMNFAIFWMILIGRHFLKLGSRAVKQLYAFWRVREP
jgi:hypothetical protein